MYYGIKSICVWQTVKQDKSGLAWAFLARCGACVFNIPQLAFSSPAAVLRQASPPLLLRPVPGLSHTQQHSSVVDWRCCGAEMQGIPGQASGHLCCRSTTGDMILGSTAAQEARELCYLPTHYPSTLTVCRLIHRYVKILLLVSKLSTNLRWRTLAPCCICSLCIQRSPAPRCSSSQGLVRLTSILIGLFCFGPSGLPLQVPAGFTKWLWHGIIMYFGSVAAQLRSAKIVRAFKMI